MDNEALASRPESPKKKIKSNPAADSEAEPSNSSGKIDVDIFVSSLIMLLFLINSCSHFFQKSYSLDNSIYVSKHAYKFLSFLCLSSGHIACSSFRKIKLCIKMFMTLCCLFYCTFNVGRR